MSALSPRSSVQVGFVYPTYTLRVSALSVCGWVGGWVCVPLKALFLVYFISNPEINIYFKVYTGIKTHIFSSVASWAPKILNLGAQPKT